ncbi:MAG TPA: AAA family ATPase [Candidatus Nanoarchaeia archaeon]|nr:AAA family ATPase [Candidatus Nanoarchaeia archaeon]
MPLIIIEGLDGTGKTSLAEKLKKEFGYGIAFGTNRGDKEVLKELNIHINDYHEDIHFINQWSSIGFNAICDRSFISGVVYGKINNKTAMLFDYCMDRIKENSEDVYFILLKADNKTIVERDEEWEGKEQELEMKRYLYSNIFKHRLKDFNSLIINTNEKSNEEVFKEVEEWLKNYNL